MTRAVLLALGVICLIGFSQALHLANTLKGDNPSMLYRLVWKGQTCSGDLASRNSGYARNYCQRSFGFSVYHTCDNTTGAVSYYTSSPDCSGEWYQVAITGVNQCSRSTEGPHAFFCGNPDWAKRDLSDAPIPKPVPGDGKLTGDSVLCDYSAGQCPTDVPVYLRYDRMDCTGSITASILQPGAKMDKCYLLLTSGAPSANYAITQDELYLYLSTYQSGCPGVERALHSTVYRKNVCQNLDYGSQKVIVPS